MSAAKDIADYIVDQGKASRVGVNIFVNFTPDDPDSMIAVYDTGGPGSDKTFGNRSIAFRSPAIQIVVRRASGKKAEAKAQILMELLDGWTGTTINDNVYTYAECRESAPFLYKRDRSSRVLFAFNVILQRRE